MLTAIKFDPLIKLPREKQLESLRYAIDWELKRPAILLDALGARAMPNVKLFGTTPAAIDVAGRMKAWLAQKYTTPSDTPALVDVSNEFEQFFHTNMPELDMAFAMLFDLVDLRSSTHDHFDILDTSLGLAWEQRRTGEPAKIRRSVSESKLTVSLLEFADGLGLLDRWLDYQQFWRIDEAIAEFRATYFDKMASLHYGLLTALGSGVDEAFDTDDAKTFNNAASTLLRNVRASGYGVSQNVQFDIVTAPEKVGRIERFLTAQRGSAMVDFGTQSQPVTYRVRSVVGTTHVTAADTGYYLVLPGRKIKRGLWQDLSVESQRNIYVSATDWVGTGRYNAAIGDTNQVRRVKFA